MTEQTDFVGISKGVDTWQTVTVRNENVTEIDIGVLNAAQGCLVLDLGRGEAFLPLPHDKCIHL